MKCALSFILSLGISISLYGQVKHTPTPNKTLSLKIINSPKISPDRRLIAYRMRETNWKDDEYVWQLWLANIATGAKFQLTRGKKSSDQEEWSPDGK